VLKNNKFKEYCNNNPEWAKNEDRIGRQTCIDNIPKFINEIEYVEEHPNKYDIDLIAYDNEDNIFTYIEAEHSNSWKTLTFPYKRMNVPIRKKKFFEKYPNSLYVMVNKPATSIAVIEGKDILDSPVREVSNKYNKSGEYFFSVNLSNIEFIVL
jgi:hypothetical protein